MENELNLLEGKVRAVTELCVRLRDENTLLRSKLERSEQEQLALKQRMNEALERIEALVVTMAPKQADI